MISFYSLLIFILITGYFIYALNVFEIYSLTDVVNTSKSTVWGIVFGNFITLLILPIVLMFISVGISLSFTDYLKLKNRSNRIEKYCKVKYNINLNNGEIPRHLGVKFNSKDKIKYINEKKKIKHESDTS